MPYLPEELQVAVANLEDPAELAHMIAGALRIKTEERQELLEELDVAKRLRRLSELLARESELISIGSRIQSQVESEIDKGQREFFLRQQLKAIQEELGEVDETQAEAAELRSQVEAAELPEHALKPVERELQRFERLPPQSAEHGVIRSYIEWIVSLPWSKGTDDHIELKNARKTLDRDHYDIEDVKDRILEFLAVRKLKPDARSAILCFVGPPGVGKTSLGRSIAAAMGREFERISVGGVRDESEIRGHRRTYIGAMPGTIMRALRDAGSNNPVLMIDEIDKMGADFRGDPSSAMLEVLDPEQNATFRDHYLDLPFDLSRVLFITTANQLEPIPPPLRDRMEVIELVGLHRGREARDRQALPRAATGRAERPDQVQDRVHRRRPARDHRGLHARGRRARPGARHRRGLPQAGPRVRRGLAPVKAHDSPKGRRPSCSAARRVQPEVALRTGEPGVATGLAWTPVGGDVLFVEATAYPGEGRLVVTGQLGDVMRESASAALSYVKRNSAALGEQVPENWFRMNDLHLHVPAGAVPKDGPSAGIAMATALSSLVTERPVRADTAMTGEITLTGRVLPIGGLKEKALAAQRAGITRVIAPRRNEPDLEDLPENLLKEMELIFVEDVDQVLEAALEPDGRAEGPRRRGVGKAARRGPRERVAARSGVPGAKPG